MSFAGDVRDAGRLVHFWSRTDLKRLPLEMVLIPTLTAPVLVFDDRAPLFRDHTGRQCAALPMIDELRQAARRLGPDVRKRRQFAKLTRRIWCQIVDQADYYTWPDADHYGAPAVFEFAPDPPC
jgi:hypothetical protein